METTVARDPVEGSVVDYRGYDFRSVWNHRGEVDGFERALLDRARQHLDPRRTLEIGTGFGRLTPQLLEPGGEYVGIDYDLQGLRDVRASARDGPHRNPHRSWLAANAYHLPFIASSFSSVCMIRVHHHLDEPLVALREIARILVPGGTALISYSPRGPVQSFAHDVRRLLGRRTVATDRYCLLAPRGHLKLRDLPVRLYITTPRFFDRDLEATGLRPIREYGGLETTGARLLPIGWGLAGSSAWPGAPVFSTRWVVARKPGFTSVLPSWDGILACPRCGARGPLGGGMAIYPGPCAACGFEFRWEDGMLDARYVARGLPPVPPSFKPPLVLAAIPFQPPGARSSDPRSPTGRTAAPASIPPPVASSTRAAASPPPRRGPNDPGRA